MSTDERQRIVLFAHGSPDPGWRRVFDDLAARLRTALGAQAVRVAYLQFSSPSFADIVAEAARDGIAHLRVLPVFLAVGAHVARDIPAEVEAARRNHPRVAIHLLPAVGTDPRMTQLLETMACEAAAGSPEPATGYAL